MAVLGAPWIAYATTQEAVDSEAVTVVVENLDTGSSTYCTDGGAIAPQPAPSVAQIVLAPGGVAAWTGVRRVSEPVTYGPQYETPGSPVAPPMAIFRLRYERQVVACSATDENVLDKGDGIDLDSLELHDSTLTWTDSGETRSAILH